MKKALCVVAMLALATAANATIDFFFTSSADPYGLMDPNLAFKHSFNDGYDLNHGYELAKVGGVYAVPNYAEPLADVQINPASGQWAYIWARFNNEPAPSVVGALNGVQITLVGAPGGIGNIAYYQLDNRQISPPQNKKWDGDPEVFYNNPTALIAIMASGQRNVAADQPYNLYIGGTHRLFLIGAVKAPQVVGQEISITIGATNYSGGSNPNPPPPVGRALNKVVAIPEPASLLLLGLATLLRRR